MTYNLKTILSDNEEPVKESNNEMEMGLMPITVTLLDISTTYVLTKIDDNYDSEIYFGPKTFLKITDPNTIIRLTLKRLMLDRDRLMDYVYPNMLKATTALGNSKELEMVNKRIINKSKILPVISINGYNYTNLDVVMNIEYSFDILFEILDEYATRIDEVFKSYTSSISPQEVCYRLRKIADDIEFDNMKPFKFESLVFNKKLPDYYRNNQTNKTEIVYREYGSVYHRIRNSKVHALTIRKYAKEYNRFLNNVINKIYNNKIYKYLVIYDMKSDIGKELITVVVNMGKLMNHFADNLFRMIVCQLNESVDCIKQDVDTINTLVSEFKKNIPEDERARYNHDLWK